jgi:hypothetical protein
MKNIITANRFWLKTDHGRCPDGLTKGSRTMGKKLIKKIISGGQTGADRAALDYAIRNGIPHGGWLPKGRRTEDGPLPETYNLQEMSTESYPKRTEKNVIHSDGTLIVSDGPLSGGSALTREIAKRYNRPWIHIDLSTHSCFDSAKNIRDWIYENTINVLNVAGPRASENTDIYPNTIKLLEQVFE